MAVAVKAALKNRNGMWFGWSGKVSEEPNGEPQVVDINKMTYVLIDLSQNDIQEYYNGLANSVLWPILHYRVDLQEYSRADASGYIRVNRLFADRLSGLLREDDVVWVHDYHLMLLGRELRSRGHRNTIGFFLHTPCAPPDILQTLPHHREILGGLAYYNLVGFQTENDRDNFAHYLTSQGATQNRGSAYEFEGQQVRLGAFPVSIETKAYMRLARNAGRSAMIALVRESLGGNKLILGVDRLDYSKGIPDRVKAFERLLENNPGVARQRDAVAGHAKEPLRHQAIWRHRKRSDRPDRQGQRPVRRRGLDADPLCQPLLFAHGPGGPLSRRPCRHGHARSATA